MAIKKRPPLNEKSIEQFGDAADAPTPKSAAAAPSAATKWPEGLAQTMHIKFPDPDLVLELNAVAQLDERSKHATALRAMRLGLEALRKELGT